jgi:MFS family permease
MPPVPFTLVASQTFASLRRHRNYRLYFSGQLVSQAGTWLQNAAQAWLVLDLTHSAEAVGVLGFWFYAPYAVLGLVGGAVADRFERHRVMMVTQTAMAVCALALAIVAWLRVDRVWVIDLIAVVRGIILVFNNPSRQALMVQLVGRGELPNAIALNSSLNNATRVIGPAIAGLLIASAGVSMCFALNALSYVAVIWALGAMRTEDFHVERSLHERTPLFASIGLGLRYAARTKTVAVVLAMLLVISLLAINFNVLLPVLARGTLHGDATIYGLLSSVFGLGAFAGALVAASRTAASRRLVLIAAAGFGLAQLFVATQRTFAGVAAGLFVTGVCYTLYTASTNALVQLATPNHLQGRVGGLYTYVFLATGPFGALLAGWLSDRGGAPLAFALGGAAAVAMVLAGLATRPWPMPTGTAGRRRSRRNLVTGP